MDATKLSPEQRQLIEEFERGCRLRDLKHSAGYETLLDLMEKRVALAEFHLINYNGNDAEIIVGLQRRARSYREFFQTIQSDIHTAIDAAQTLPSMTNPELTGL